MGRGGGLVLVLWTGRVAWVPSCMMVASNEDKHKAPASTPLQMGSNQFVSLPVLIVNRHQDEPLPLDC